MNEQKQEIKKIFFLIFINIARTFSIVIQNCSKKECLSQFLKQEKTTSRRHSYFILDISSFFIARPLKTPGITMNIGKRIGSRNG